MHFLVTPMRERGLARPWPEIRGSVPVRGDLRVNNEMCEAMNRTSNVARVNVGMPLDADPLPALLDAFMSGMATNAFTMSGVELVDGVLYAQSWWCREI